MKKFITDFETTLDIAIIDSYVHTLLKLLIENNEHTYIHAYIHT